MKLFSSSYELKAIRTITSGASKADSSTLDVTERTAAAATVLSSVDDSWFYYEPCKAALKRIQSIAKKRGAIIAYEDLLEDPALDEEYRDILRENKKRTAKDVTEAKTLVAGLDKYRKARALYFMAKDIMENLKESSVDVDHLMDSATNQLTKARARENIGDIVLTIGKDANALDLVDEALSMEDDKLLKTGFKEFDDKNGGLPAEGVFILAATTSGGKSAMRMVLMKNIYKLNNVSVLTVSMEMNAKKETRRLLSNLTGLPYWKYVKKKLDTAERKESKRSWRRFHRHGDENDCQYALLCPSRGVTITQLLMMVKPYNYQVIAIDYISLLEGVSEDNQWRILGDIVRECKVFSGENHCLIMLLAQLDSEDDRVRYSKAIIEHADNAWRWNYSKQEQRDLHILPIHQMKARDQELYSFELRENFGFMQILNMDEDGSTDQSGGEHAETKSAVDDPLSKENVNYDDGVG